jgi:ATP-grasp domain-containing protein
MIAPIMQQDLLHLWPRTFSSDKARRRNLLYSRFEKVMSLLLSCGARRILFSAKPEWESEIKSGFRRLPHQIEFGPINEESFQRYDIVVPLSLDTLEIARRCSPFAKTVLPLPSRESVHLCDDKYQFNQTLIAAGFGRYIPKLGNRATLTLPYILKKRIGEWGKDCFVVRNPEDEAMQLGRITNSEYFCQELIPGSEEFATHILFVGGRIIKALNIKYEFRCDTPIKGQDTAIAQSVYRCQFLDEFAQILEAIQFQGLCCVNYKVANGQPFLLEINPRFGGSLAPYFFAFIRHLR